MWIQYERTSTNRHHNDEYMPEGYFVEPNENGVAQVKKEVGEVLIENYDTIHKYEAE